MSEQITVFGANGKVGQLVVSELIARGYTVVAFVHNASHFTDSPQLKVCRGDIYDAQQVNQALAGSTAVISALGSWGTKKKNILSVGMSHIIPAMKAYGITRIVSLTGADARASGDDLGLIHRLTHPVLSVVMSKIMGDGELHLSLLEKSELDWTVIRSPIMSKRQTRTDQYTLNKRRALPWQTIPYRLVALSMVNAIQDRTWSKQAPYIHR